MVQQCATYVCSSEMLGEHIEHLGNSSGGGWCSGWNIQKQHYHGATARWFGANGVPCWNYSRKHAETIGNLLHTTFMNPFSLWDSRLGRQMQLATWSIWSLSDHFQRLNNDWTMIEQPYRPYQAYRSFSILLALTFLDVAQAWCGGRIDQQRPPQTGDEWSKLAGGAKQFYWCCYWR